jgi:quercetin dioxygenase-like cupin family protein
MHRTDTCDVIDCVKGEIYLMTDTDEVLMTPGDSTVIRGVNHAWSNRSQEPALLAVAMIDAIPQS